MDLSKKMRKYFVPKQGKILELSNGYSVKLTIVETFYSGLMLRFYYNNGTADINFKYYDSFIISFNDVDSSQIKVVDMHHVGYIIDTTLCKWVESEDETDLIWK